MKTATRQEFLERLVGLSGLCQGSELFLRSKDSVVVLGFKKSEGGRRYHIQVGVWLNAFGSVAHPSEGQCQLRCRLEDLFVSEDLSLLRMACEADARGGFNAELVERCCAQIGPQTRSLLIDLLDFGKLRAFYQGNVFKFSHAVAGLDRLLKPLPAGK